MLRIKTFHYKNPSLLPIYIVLFLIGVYGVICIFLSSRELNLDELHGFKIDTFSDTKFHNGDSKSSINIHKSGEIEYSYTLGHKAKFPYTTLEIRKKNHKFFQSGNSILLFTAVADSEMRIPIRVRVHIDDFTKEGLPDSELMLEKMVMVKKGKNHISLPTREMTIPAWWFTLNNITEKQLPEFDLEQTSSIEFAKDQLLQPGDSARILIKDLRIKNDLFIYHKIALIIFSLVILGLILFQWLSRFSKRPVYIPIEDKKLSMDKNDDLSRIKGVFANSYSNSEFRSRHVAEETGISETKIGAILKKETSMTFAEYLNFVRIEEGKRLLVESDLPISEIGYRIGFDYPQSFNRSFKKITNLSPGEFRDLNSILTK